MLGPARNDRSTSSAARVDADVLLLDIEDSVQPAANKQVARATTSCAILPTDGSGAVVLLSPRQRPGKRRVAARRLSADRRRNRRVHVSQKQERRRYLFLSARAARDDRIRKGISDRDFQDYSAHRNDGRRYEHTRDLQRLSEPALRRSLSVARISSPIWEASTIPKDRVFFYGAGPDRHGRQSMRGDSDRHGAYSRT